MRAFASLTALALLAAGCGQPPSDAASVDAGPRAASDADAGAPPPADAGSNLGGAVDAGSPPGGDNGLPSACGATTGTEPMALGEPLYPYAWDTARDADGNEVGLDLSEVGCASDAWSPFDALLFIAIPAW